MNDKLILKLKITNSDSFKEKTQTWRFIDSLVKDMWQIESVTKDDELNNIIKKFVDNLQAQQKEIEEYLKSNLIMDYTQQYLRSKK